MVQQLAAYHEIYVVYTSLARGDSAFPGRSPVADKIPRNVSMDSLEEFLEDLHHDELSRSRGVQDGRDHACKLL